MENFGLLFATLPVSQKVQNVNNVGQRRYLPVLCVPVALVPVEIQNLSYDLAVGLA
jgi:hypothetical protein